VAAHDTVLIQRQTQGEQRSFFGTGPRGSRLLPVPQAIRGRNAKGHTTVLLQPAGKRQRQALMAADACSTLTGRLFITDSQQPEILGRHRFRSQRVSPKARPWAQGAHQLRSLRGQRYTHSNLRRAHPQAQPRTSTGFHLALRGVRRTDPNYRGGPARQIWPFGRLTQQYPGRDHVLVSSSPDCIPTVPECEDH